MVEEKVNQKIGKFTKITVKCTCGLLIGTVLSVSLVEISKRPIHSGGSCQTPHIEQPYISLGTINASVTFA